MTTTVAPPAATTVEPVAPPAAPPRWGYRPQIDGLRAVAVYLVVAFHAGLGRASGGFIGVDIFFVLSGYLVTKLLLRDLSSRGHVRMTWFYARRMRRLLPASVATLLVTGVIWSAVASPAEVSDAVGAIKSAFLYVSNWFFIRQSTDYFANDINSSPVLHFWSLSIEEQFYFIWPLILSGLYLATRRLGRHQWNVVRLFVLGAGLLSLASAVHLAQSNVSRAYYGTDTRAYQLLAGAFLALTPAVFTRMPRPRTIGPLLSIAALGTLLILGSSALTMSPITRGAFAAVATCLLIITMETSSNSPVTRGLSVGPVTYLGAISYGIYLWHWPVIIIITRGFDMSARALFAITVLLATALAALSAQMLERPIRQSPRLNRVSRSVVAIGLATSVVCAVIVTPVILDDDSATGVAELDRNVGQSFTPVPADLDWESALNDIPDLPDCLGAPVEQCVIVPGDGPTVAIMGDSHARMLLPSLVPIAEREGWNLAALITTVCPWEDDLYYRSEQEKCREHKDDWRDRVMPELDPDLVILEHRGFDDPHHPEPYVGPDGRMSPNKPEFEQTIAQHTRKTLDRLRVDGRRVLLIEPTPMPPEDLDPLTCLSEATYYEDCRYVIPEKPTPTEQLYRDLAEQNDDVFSLDVDPLVCPYKPICDPVVDGMVVKRDPGHLTATFAATFADPIQRYIEEFDVLG